MLEKNYIWSCKTYDARMKEILYIIPTTKPEPSSKYFKKK